MRIHLPLPVQTVIALVAVKVIPSVPATEHVVPVLAHDEIGESSPAADEVVSADAQGNGDAVAALNQVLSCSLPTDVAGDPPHPQLRIDCIGAEVLQLE